MTPRDLVDADYRAALLVDDPVALYEQAPCGYLSMAPDGVVVKTNATFLRWTGYSIHEIVRRPFTELLTPGGRIYLETHLRPMLHLQGSVHEIALEMLNCDGSAFPVLINAVLERDQDDRPQAIRVAVFDATERRRYELELMAAKEEAETERERSRQVNATLQRAILPPSAPTVPGLDVAAAYHPAGDGTAVGGDFYDCFPVGEGEWFAVLGDVCGKGPEAAIITTLVRYTVRGLAAVLPRPRDVLAYVNRILLEHHSSRFCTVVVARLIQDDDGWSVTLADGGHPPALVVSPTGALRSVRPPGPLVGVLDSPTFEEDRLWLAPGETLLLYTDGVTEARGEAGFYDHTGLSAACRRYGSDPRTLVDGLLSEVLTHQAGFARDDIAILAFGRPPADGALQDSPAAAEVALSRSSTK